MDGTLVEGNTWAGLLSYPELSRFRVFQLYAKTIPSLIGRRFYLLGDVRFRHRWVKGMAGLLKGWPRTRTQELFTWLVKEKMVGQYRQDVILRLEQHKAEGDYIVLVSTMYDEVIQLFADVLGANAGIGTVLAYDQNHICTGSISGKSCAGPRKLDFIRTYLAQQSFQVDMADCYAYADSFSDAPMLAAVGHPVAIHPDDELRAAAIEQGWEIISQ